MPTANVRWPYPPPPPNEEKFQISNFETPNKKSVRLSLMTSFVKKGPDVLLSNRAAFELSLSTFNVLPDRV